MYFFILFIETRNATERFKVALGKNDVKTENSVDILVYLRHTFRTLIYIFLFL